MERAKIWSKMGEWLRAVRGNGSDAEASIRLTKTGLVRGRNTDTSSGVQSTEQEVPPEEDTRSARRCDVARMGSEVARLSKSAEGTSATLRSLESHLEEQDRQSETLARSLAELAKSLRATSEALRAQLDEASAIRVQIAQQAEHLDQIDQRLSMLDRIAAGQREAHTAVSRLREQSRETDERATAQFEQLARTVGEVNEKARSVGVVVGEIRTEGAAREERIATRIEDRLIRYAKIAWIAMGIAMIVGVAGVIVAMVK